jgi:hypothetical protein
MRPGKRIVFVGNIDRLLPVHALARCVRTGMYVPDQLRYVATSVNERSSSMRKNAGLGIRRSFSLDVEMVRVEDMDRVCIVLGS